MTAVNTLDAGKVSVIIVTYKRLDYLKLTIDAVLNQTYANLDLVVVADGHQQDVADYIATHTDARLSYLYVDHCGYPAKGRNLGLSKTDSKFVAFCDDDDVWALDKLEKQLNVFGERPELVLCCTNRKIIDSHGVISEQKSLKWLPATFNLDSLLLSNYITYSSVLLKREVLARAGEFPDDIKFKAIEDYHLWIRVAYFGPIYFLDEPLVLYRIHNANISTKLAKGAKRNLSLYKDLFRKYKIPVYNKLKAFGMAYFKILYYTLKGA